MHTWTYNPQKRQDGSAFALTYIPRLRSCKLLDAFVISSLPVHVVRGVTTQQGPIAPSALPDFIATAGPSATLSPSAHFPVRRL